jgi:hypothetical protein
MSLTTMEPHKKIRVFANEIDPLQDYFSTDRKFHLATRWFWKPRETCASNLIA